MEYDYEWTSDLAYAVGLVTADGCLSSDGRHIDFSSKDKALVVLFRALVNAKHNKIGIKKNGLTSQNICYRVQLGNISFYKWLRTIGLHPRKSKSLVSIKVPSEYFFDFLRGVWDGDGTVYFGIDKRWESSFSLTFGFAGASLPFLCWLQHNINTELGTTGFITQGKNVLQLRYARQDSLKLFQAMFYDTRVPHLERKFTKAKKGLILAGLLEN